MKKIFTYLQQVWTASIRRQFMLGIILVHAVLMSIFVYDLVSRQQDFLKIQGVAQVTSLATTLAANSVSWMLANDVVGLEEVMEVQSGFPDLHFAMVLSPEGRVIGHTEIDKVGLYVSDAVSAKLLKAKHEQIILVNNKFFIDIASPIISDGSFIGWARVNTSQKESVKNIQVITRDGVLYTLLAIVIGSLFAFFMARGITRGLQHIVDVAEGIKSGDMSSRASLSRHDEVGKLGEDFNIMLDTINKSKRDFDAVMDNSPAVIYAKDINGRYIFVNTKWATLFKIKKHEIVGKTDHEFFDKEFADKFRENDLGVLKAGQALKYEETAPQDDGIHTYLTVKFPLFDENRNIYAICGISTDITDQKQIEKEKVILENQLYHSQKMQSIGQLTGGVAHDFNNLLAVILGYAELSQTMFGKDNESLAKYLNEIETAGNRGRELIQQMMIYSRKDQTQKDLELINLNEVLEETQNMLKATFSSGIKITTFIEKDIPSVTANSSLLSQVLLNLCINAKDGMNNEGELSISINHEYFKDRVCHSCYGLYTGDYVVINVEDNGSGIAEDKLNRIFEPFYTSKNVGEGTGMGLSVVHGIVHKLGGHIVVNSTVGKGTHFKILLPVSDKINEEKNEQVLISLEYDFSGLNIMIVDDEPAVASLLEISLKELKANTVVFTDSKQALAYFERDPKNIDFVITDQTMPDVTGIELSKTCLALNPDIKIILCTGFSVDVTEESALQLGIKHFVNKPVKMSNIHNIINELK